MFQHLSVFLVVRGPKLNTVLEVLEYRERHSSLRSSSRRQGERGRGQAGRSSPSWQLKQWASPIQEIF